MIWAILLGILLPVAFYLMPKTMSWIASLYAPTKRTRFK